MGDLTFACASHENGLAQTAALTRTAPVRVRQSHPPKGGWELAQRTTREGPAKPTAAGLTEAGR